MLLCDLARKFFHKFEYLPMLKNTTDSLSKVRTNIREHKSIILDSFHEDFLVGKKNLEGVTRSQVTWYLKG